MALTEGDFVRIFEATRLISSTLRLSDLLSTVMRLAGEVVRAEASSILLMDPVTEELYFDVALGSKGGALQQIRLKRGEGIAGWVAATRRPALVNDVAKDPRWTQKADKTSQFQTKSILAVPMIAKDKLIGVMEAINRADGQPFTEMDQKILEMFAAQAAVGIENARLFESIRQEKEKMGTILGQMSEGSLLLDLEGKILLANTAAETFLNRATLKQTSWSDIEKNFSIQPSWETLRQNARGPMPIELTRKEGPPFILSGLLTPVSGPQNQTSNYLVVLDDVTEERREAQLKRNFLALVSHKLKTPLVSIRGFAPMLLEKPEELTPFQKTAIETIDRNSLLLTSLVEKLVWFSAMEAETLELLPKLQSVASLFDAALTDVAPYLRAHPAELERDASLNDLPAVHVDKQWMKEVLRNLIENAIKFGKAEPRRVRMSGRVADSHVEIWVADNAVGIPPEEREKIFQKFYQVESSFTGQVEGMGLGLALVKRVVEAHNGTVTVESELGKGSTFKISLPLEK